MIRRHTLHIAPGIQRRQLRRTELLDGHHAPEATDGRIVKRILEDLPHLAEKRVLGDLRENRDVLRCVLHMDVDLVGIRFILRCRGFHNGIKNGLLARKVIVERGRLDPDRFGDLTHADGIVSPRGEQLQRLVQNFLPCIFLLHSLLPRITN